MFNSAAIYARVSTEHQAEYGYSLAAQIEACRKLAADSGAAGVVEYIDDGYSGAFLERPQLEKMRDALHEKLHDIVIVYTPDRLSRSLAHQLVLTDEIKHSGAVLRFVLGEYKDTPEGRMFYQMQGAFAEYEREKIRERTVRGVRSKLKSGKPLGSNLPFGYKFNENGDFEIVEEQAKVIRLIYHLYAVEKIGGCEAVSRYLNDRSILSPTGKFWHYASIHEILRRAAYTGDYFAYTKCSKKVSAGKVVKTKREKSEWIPLKCAPIIDKELFEEARKVAETKRSYKIRSTADSPIPLLQGFLRCGFCGHKIKITNSPYGRFYGCAKRASKNIVPIPCAGRYARIEIVDEIFWDFLSKIMRNAKNLETYFESTIPKESENVKSTRQTLEKRLSRIQKERPAVMEWFSSGLIDQQAATVKLQKLKDDESAILRDLASLPKDAPRVIDAKKICGAFSTCPANVESRRHFLMNIIEYIIFKRLDKNYGSNYELSFEIHFK